MEPFGLPEAHSYINRNIQHLAPVEWPDDLDISNLAPSEYFPKYASYMSHETRSLGIEKDYDPFYDRKNWDGWLQHLVNIIRKNIGTDL